MKILGMELSRSPVAQLHPGQQLLIVSIIILLAALAVAHNGILQPLARKRSQLEQDLQVAVQRAALIQQLETNHTKILEAKKQLPMRSEAGGMLQEISDLAAAKQVTIHSVSPQSLENIGRDYARQMVRIEASGGYMDLLNFCLALESSPLPFQIERLEVLSGAPEPVPTLQINLTASILMRES